MEYFIKFSGDVLLFSEFDNHPQLHYFSHPETARAQKFVASPSGPNVTFSTLLEGASAPSIASRLEASGDNGRSATIVSIGSVAFATARIRIPEGRLGAVALEASVFPRTFALFAGIPSN